MNSRATDIIAGNSRDKWLAVAVISLLTLLVSPDIMRSYGEINPFDEAKYIESGRLLLSGELRNLTWGPLLALVYAPLHALLGRSLDWFALDASLGRIILYLGLLFSTYFLAGQFKTAIHKHYILGVLFISTAYLGVLSNPSDALFVTMSSVSLAKVVTFLERRREADIAWASAFYGLAVLCRFEAVVLLIPVVMAVVLVRRSLGSPLRAILASILPAALILAVYLFLFSLTSRGADLGIGSKSYASF